MPNKVKDISGQRFGKLVVLRRYGYTNSKRKLILWLCRCDCGNEVLRTAPHLRQNENPSCGKCRLIKDSDYVGKQFGYWTVISAAKPKNRKKSYLCECKCGNRKIVNADTLKLGTSKSCGCFQKDLTSKRETTHGMTGTRIYGIYHNMKNRCCNPNDGRYKDYGGRGITVCKDWLGEHGFENFYKWSIDNGYTEELTIDRINVDGNYSPSNCRWTTNAEQANNRRNCIYFTFFGVTKNLKEWCGCIGESYNKMYGRYSRGYETFRKEDMEKIKKYVKNGGM